LLDYSNQRELAGLCQTIHALRGHCGRAVKIVVRERNEFMRHQYELLMLSLGANLVIGRDVPFSRLQSLLKSVQGQLNTRPIAADFQTALSAALCDSVCGYLTVPLFCEQVEQVIGRAHVLDLPHMLLELHLRPEIAHLDALKACTLRRAGDICTAYHHSLYLFLFACRVSDADAVLQRIFGTNLERFFEDEVRYIDEIDFIKQSAKLKGNNVLRAAPDYSDALALHQIEAPAQEPARARPEADAVPAAAPADPDAAPREAAQSALRLQPRAEAYAMPVKKSTRS